MTVNTAELIHDRWSVDPRESAPMAGDLVTLSDYNLLWTVTTVSRDGSTAYLRSVLGKRAGQESTSRIKNIWRDPNAIAAIDWSQAYGEDEGDIYAE